MSLDVAKRALAVLMDAGIHDIRLTGGEPTTHPQFGEIIALIQRHEVSIGLVSNGILLLQERWAKKVLPALSRCWISVYGLQECTHGAVSGSTRSLAKTLEQVGRYSQAGYPIGISALVNVSEGHYVTAFMQAALDHGIGRLRFLPVQPDGRMLQQDQPDWYKWPGELGQMVQDIRGFSHANHFEVLTVNDPFDLADRFGQSLSSCLLQHRRMWSITQSGDIYACCFTVGRLEHRIGNISDTEITQNLRELYKLEEAQQCHGLDPAFWPRVMGKCVTCPIGSVDPR